MNADALYKLTHGVYVLGADDHGRPVGSVVDAVMQAANKPPVIALSCHNGSYTKNCIEKSGRFSLSVLSRDVDPFVVANFGFQSSRDTDKWDNVPHFMENALPYLQNCIAVMSCRVLDKQVFESNTLVTAEVIDCRDIAEGQPLTYSDYRTSFKNEVLKFLPNILKAKEKKNG